MHTESNTNNKISQITIAPVAIILCLIAVGTITVTVIITVTQLKRRSKKKSDTTKHTHSHLDNINEKLETRTAHTDSRDSVYDGTQLTPTTIKDKHAPIGHYSDSVDVTTNDCFTPSSAITLYDNNTSQKTLKETYSTIQKPSKSKKAKSENPPPIPPYRVDDVYAVVQKKIKCKTEDDEKPPPVPPQTNNMLYAAVR